MDVNDSSGANSPKIGYNPVKDVLSINTGSRGRPQELKVHKDNGEIHPHLLEVYRALTGATDERCVVKPFDERLGRIIYALQDGSVFLDVLEQQGLCPELQNYGNGDSPGGVHETDGDFGQTTMQEPIEINLDRLYPSDITPEMVLLNVYALQDTNNPVRKPGYLAAYIIGKDWAPAGIVRRVDKYLDELTKDGLLGTEESGFYHKNTGRFTRSKIYVATSEGVEYLATGELPKGLPNSAYRRHDKPPANEFTSVSMAEPTENGALENLGSDSPDTTEIVSDETITDTPQKKGRTIEKDEGPTYVYGEKYNWEELYSAIYGEFKDLLSGNSESVPKLNVNGAESFLLYTSLDTTGGFPGAVYLCLDGDAFCAGYVDQSGKVIPSPEAVWATFINKNASEGKKVGRRALISFFKELDEADCVIMTNIGIMQNLRQIKVN